MLCAGAVRLKNVRNAMLKNFLDACGAALGFYSVGYAFAYGATGAVGAPPGSSSEPTFVGSSNFFLRGVDDLSHWLFQFAFAATAATIVAGTLAERCQMASYLCYSVALTGFVYPVVARAVWSDRGFLSPLAAEPLWGSGVVDFAGSGVVHTTGGVSAIIATKILGARNGRFHDARGRPLKKPKDFPGHSIALQMLGTFILWFGWYGFNAGSALSISSNVQSKIASLAAVNTTLSAAMGGVSALFLKLVIEERRTGEPRFDIVHAMNGCLSGLVSVTAGCAVVEPWAAVVVGFVAGSLYVGSSELLIRMRLDDAVDAIPVHLFGGVWGVIAVGLLAAPEKLADAYPLRGGVHPGIFYSWSAGNSDATLLACQVVSVLFIVGWVSVFMIPFFIWLNYMGWFRADHLEEMVGLDISYHGIGAGGDGATDEAKMDYVAEFERRRRQRIRERSQTNVSEDYEERRPSRVASRTSFSEEEPHTLNIGEEH